MKTTKLIKTEINITHVRVIVPVRYDEEDIPNDFPFRNDDTWEVLINVDTGLIEGWPEGRKERVQMKVCDGGTYILLDDGEEVERIECNYVPNRLIPGEYGDYIDLRIDESGKITNWPTRPNVDAFFLEDDE